MKTAIILPHLSNCQLVTEVMDMINSRHNASYTIFYENISPKFKQVSAPVMNITELINFSNGRVIGFTLDSIKYMEQHLGNAEYIAYLYDLEWLRGKNDFLSNLKLLRNPAINIYSRSLDYCKLINNYANIQSKYLKLEELI